MVGKERARCRKEEEDEQHGREVWKEGRYGGARVQLAVVVEAEEEGGEEKQQGRRARGSYERERVWGRGDGKQNSNFWQHFQVRFYLMMFPVPFIRAVLVGAECGRRRANS